jgi:hypothetical protein
MRKAAFRCVATNPPLAKMLIRRTRYCLVVRPRLVPEHTARYFTFKLVYGLVSVAAGPKPMKTRRLKSANGRYQEFLKAGYFSPPPRGKNSSTTLLRELGGEKCFSGPEDFCPLDC